jgi:amino-acid N-acetyltransferase
MIRKATVADARTIQKLVNTHAEKGTMLSLSLHEIFDSLRDFSVFEDNTEIIGVCALSVCWDDLAEIRSLVVCEEHRDKEIGSQLIRYSENEARELGIKKIFALSYSPEFFEKSNFTRIDKSELPHKIWADCIKCVHFPDCQETALAKTLSHEGED